MITLISNYPVIIHQLVLNTEKFSQSTVVVFDPASDAFSRGARDTVGEEAKVR